MKNLTEELIEKLIEKLNKCQITLISKHGTDEIQLNEDESWSEEEEGNKISTLSLQGQYEQFNFNVGDLIDADGFYIHLAKKQSPNEQIHLRVSEWKPVNCEKLIEGK